MIEDFSIVFIGHGSRDPGSNEQMERFVSEYANAHPGCDVKFGYIELARPFMKEVLREVSKKSKNVIAVPLLFFRAGHVKIDISEGINEIKNEFPDIKLYVCDVLGVHPLLSELGYLRAEKTGIFRKDHKNISALFIGRGSSDPDANANLFRQARLFEEGGRFNRVLACFEGVARPGIDETMDFLIRSDPDAVLVMPHFLFRGILTERISQKVELFKKNYPRVNFYLAGELGIHDNLFNLIDERISEVLSGKSNLQCDNCSYRLRKSSQEKHAGVFWETAREELISYVETVNLEKLRKYSGNILLNLDKKISGIKRDDSTFLHHQKLLNLAKEIEREIKKHEEGLQKLYMDLKEIDKRLNIKFSAGEKD